jgi:Nif-specific regulatory protein
MTTENRRDTGCSTASLASTTSLAVPRFAYENSLELKKPGACRRKSHPVHRVDRIITQSPAMQKTLQLVRQFAVSQVAVLLRGEAGSGKEVIARAIHMHSAAHEGPFVKLCCDYASDEELMLALFGCEAGFFQGVPARQGVLQQAQHGTLFLSEIGHFSLAMQKRLLRLLQEPHFTPLGSHQSQPCLVRLVCASEKDLEQLMVDGDFLPELYYRIHLATIPLPALRERKEDIPGLAAYFFERYNQKNGVNLQLSDAALAPLYLCQWPANVRDFENCLEYAALQATDAVITQLPCLSGQCIRQRLNQQINACKQTHAVAAVLNDAPDSPALAPPLWQPVWAMSAQDSQVVEEGNQQLRYRVIAALEKSGGVKAKAARLLNITPRQLIYALKKLQIEVKKF